MKYAKIDGNTIVFHKQISMYLYVRVVFNFTTTEKLNKNSNKNLFFFLNVDQFVILKFLLVSLLSLWDYPFCFSDLKFFPKTQKLSKLSQCARWNQSCSLHRTLNAELEIN